MASAAEQLAANMNVGAFAKAEAVAYVRPQNFWRPRWPRPLNS